MGMNHSDLKTAMMVTIISSFFLAIFLVPMATGTFEGTVCTGGDEFGNGANCGDASDDPLTQIYGIAGVVGLALVLLVMWSRVFRDWMGQSKSSPSGSSFTPSNTNQDPEEDSDKDENTEVEKSSDWWKGDEEDPSSK